MSKKKLVALQGAKLKQLREERGLDVAALAQRSGLSERTILWYEEGTHTAAYTLTPKIANPLARALGMSMDALYRQIEEQTDMIGDRVRKLRLATNGTQSVLAKKTGFRISYISKIENSKMYPDAVAIRKLAEALGTSEDHLKYGEESHCKPAHPDNKVIASYSEDSEQWSVSVAPDSVKRAVFDRLQYIDKEERLINERLTQIKTERAELSAWLGDWKPQKEKKCCGGCKG